MRSPRSSLKLAFLVLVVGSLALRLMFGNAPETAGILSSEGQGKAYPRPEPSLTASAAVLMEAQTAELLFERNARQRRDPASTTKIMTAIVAIESARLDEWVSVSPEAAYVEGSSMGLKADDVLTLEDLLYGLMLESGNDAAVAIAEHVAGSVAEFSRLMNRKAWEIGLKDTHFVNPHGLTEEDHYTSAYDLALLTRYALRNPVFARIVNTTERNVTELRSWREMSLFNTNRLLHWYDFVEGVKTGTTAAAGQCLVTAATRGGMRLIAVVLNSGERWEDSLRLLDHGFENFMLKTFVAEGSRITVPVHMGVRKHTSGIVEKNLSYPVFLGDIAQARILVELEPPVAPVYVGQPLGEVRLLVGGRIVARSLIIAREEVGFSVLRSISPLRR